MISFDKICQTFKDTIAMLSHSLIITSILIPMNILGLLHGQAESPIVVGNSSGFDILNVQNVIIMEEYHGYQRPILQ